MVARRRLADGVCVFLGVASLLSALLASDADTKLVLITGPTFFAVVWSACVVPERNKRKVRIVAWLVALLLALLGVRSIHKQDDRVVLICLAVIMLGLSEWLLARLKRFP